MQPILVPMLNANEPEARLVAIHAREGQAVKAGDLLFTIETTKAASEVESPGEGVLRLVAQEGATLAVGEVLAYLAASAEEALPETVGGAEEKVLSGAENPVSGLRITAPARALAQSLGVDLARLPLGRLVTEAVVRQFTAASAATTGTAASGDLPRPQTGILLYGAGGHAKTVLEMIRTGGAFPVLGILDDNPALWGSAVLGTPVLGGRDKLAELRAQGVIFAANGVGGIINIEVRVRLFELLAASGFAFPALLHPRAVVEASARIGEGVQVFAQAYVGSSAVLQEKCMVNTSAVVSHDCEIGAYTHIAPGCLLAGHVRVGSKALVGMGVTTTIGIQIGEGARIGNGAILLADVPARGVIQAGKVWTGN